MACLTFDRNTKSRNTSHPKVPLSEKEYLKKFEICCQSSKKKIKTDKVDQFIDFILNVETKSNIIDLFKII